MLAVTVAAAALAAVGGGALVSLVTATPHSPSSPDPLPVVKGPLPRAGPEPSRWYRRAPVVIDPSVDPSAGSSSDPPSAADVAAPLPVDSDGR
jgi:hypothetical protein